MNIPDKTKDWPKARKDLQDLKIRVDLHMPPRKKSEETETETEAWEEGQKSKGRGLLPPFLLHLKSG